MKGDCRASAQASRPQGLRLALLAGLVFLGTAHAAVPQPSEFLRARAWTQSSFTHEQRLPPISFRYGDAAFSELASRLEAGPHHETTDRLTVRSVTEFRDPASGLEIVAEVIQYLDYPAVEWVVRLRNAGERPTPVLSDIRALDGRFAAKTALLHGSRGASNEPDDFAPFQHNLTANQPLRFAAKGGLSSQGASLPFFNLEFASGGRDTADGGVLLAIGWSGQWAADFEAQPDAVRLRAGMERTHLRLLPGETIRTPRTALLFWEGTDALRGNNLFRSFALAHHTPRPDGRLPNVPLAAMPWFHFDYGNSATAANQMKVVELYREKQIPVNTFWLDAGWFQGGWPKGIGSWFVKQDAFPGGLRPFSDALHKLGMRLAVWFESETAFRGSWMDQHHPKWLRGEGERRLVDLGNPEARSWLTNHISEMIAREGIDVYRQDFSLEPLAIWRKADEPDRQGMTEIRYVEGLYEFWDELLRRHPGLLIDNACSGGRRIDLETMSRSLPLWRVDYFGTNMDSFQVHGVGLGLFVPLHSSGVPPTPKNPAAYTPNLYISRSAMAAGAPFTWDVTRADFDDALARKIVKEHIRIRDYYLGDLYPLTPVLLDDDRWLAFQYHRADSDQGMILLFRRGGCDDSSMLIHPRGLSAGANYEFRFSENASRQVLTPKALKDGIQVTITGRPGSELILYRKVR